MSEQPKLENGRFSAKVEKDDPYLLFINRMRGPYREILSPRF